MTVTSMNDMFHAPVLRKDLRPHQISAIDMLRASLGKGFRRVVVQMPTGAGKTVTAARIIERALAKGNRVIFTAPAVNLIDQTVTAFEAEGIRDIGVMQANHPRTDRHAKVQVASVQTLARRDIPQAAMVIVDECHIRADVIDQMMDERPDVFFVGLSATPWAKGMGRRWQDLVIPVTIGGLINAGYLSEFRVLAPDVPDLSGVQVKGGEYVEAGLMKVMGDHKILGNVVENWLANGDNRPTLAFGINRAHADQMYHEFRMHGVSSAYVDGNTDVIERGIIARKFRSGEVAVICSVRTMTTGVDLPISCIIDAAPTKSEILHVQKIGRGLRVNPGTETLTVFDHAGNTTRLGLVTEIGLEKLDCTAKGAKQERKAKAERLPTPCVKCGVLFTGRLCVCGHERVPPRMEHAEGSLVEVKAGQAATRETKQAWWSALIATAQHRRRSMGWASHAYRERFGVWPRGLEDVSGPVPPEVRNFVVAKDIRFAKSRER